MAEVLPDWSVWMWTLLLFLLGLLILASWQFLRLPDPPARNSAVKGSGAKRPEN